MLATFLALAVAIAPITSDTTTPVHAMKRLSVEKRAALAKLVGAPLPKEPPLRPVVGRLPSKGGTPRLGTALQNNSRSFDDALRRAGLLQGDPQPRRAAKPPEE